MTRYIFSNHIRDRNVPSSCCSIRYTGIPSALFIQTKIQHCLHNFNPQELAGTGKFDMARDTQQMRHTRRTTSVMPTNEREQRRGHIPSTGVTDAQVRKIGSRQLLTSERSEEGSSPTTTPESQSLRSRSSTRHNNVARRTTQRSTVIPQLTSGTSDAGSKSRGRKKGKAMQESSQPVPETFSAHSRSVSPEIPSRSSTLNGSHSASPLPDRQQDNSDEDSVDETQHGNNVYYSIADSDNSDDDDFEPEADLTFTGKSKNRSASSQLRDLARESLITISTTSGSQRSHIPCTSVPRQIPTPHRSPSFPISSTGGYSSPLGPLTTGRSTSRSSIRSTSDMSVSGTSGSSRHDMQDATRLIPSRKNLVLGPERAILQAAKDIILRKTLFADPFPGPAQLTTLIHVAWDLALAKLSESGFIQPSSQSAAIVCLPSSYV